MDFIIDNVGDATLKLISESNETPSAGSNSFVKRVMKEYRKYKDNDNPNEDFLKMQAVKKGIEPQIDYNSPFFEAICRKSTPDVNAIMEKCVLTTEFEKAHAVPDADTSKRLIQKKRKIEAAKTKGKDWFNLPATEMTDEVKHDLEVLQMRSVLDPKHFYKKNDLKVLPKYFQIGKVMDSHLDHYNNRLTKKERKGTLVDELMADAEFQKYNKRKYKEIIEERQKTHYKAYKQAKRMKRKNKK